MLLSSNELCQNIMNNDGKYPCSNGKDPCNDVCLIIIVIGSIGFSTMKNFFALSQSLKIEKEKQNKI